MTKLLLKKKCCAKILCKRYRTRYILFISTCSEEYLFCYLTHENITPTETNNNDQQNTNNEIITPDETNNFDKQIVSEVISYCVNVYVKNGDAKDSFLHKGYLNVCLNKCKTFGKGKFTVSSGKKCICYTLI